MQSLSVLSAKYAIPAKSLKRLLIGEDLDFADDGFEIDKPHQKAIFELNRKRLSPYVIAYAIWCKDVVGWDENFIRYDNLIDIADARGLCLREAISDVYPKRFESDKLPTAQHWLDRLSGHQFDRDAIDRIANWCRRVLSSMAPPDVEYPYLAARALYSIPIEEMHNYPRPVQRAINLALHYGSLEDCYTDIKERDGSTRRIFHRPKFDL